MEIEDFSNGFDTLCNSFAVAGGFGDTHPDVRFDEYEKSLFLTKSQEELVIGLYSGKNPYGESFESTEEMRRYLSPLVAEVNLEPIENSSGNLLGMNKRQEGETSLSQPQSYFFTLPDGEGEKPEVWFITYEGVSVSGKACDHGDMMDVYPVKQDEYHKIKRNPFRGANDRRVLRLDLADGVVEIVSKYDVTEYYVRYLRKPKPIILEDLPDGLEIEGESDKMGCELHEGLHQKILEGAVMMGLRSKGVKV